MAPFFRGPLTVAALALASLFPPAAEAKSPITGKININAASAAELILLPGVGPVIAERIVEHRKTQPFDRAWEITKVKGIGAKMFRKLEGYLEVSGPTTLEKPEKRVVKKRKRASKGSAPARRAGRRGPKIIDFRDTSRSQASVP